MKYIATLTSLALTSVAFCQEGPFDPAAWPPTANPSADIHYITAGDDPDAIPPPPGAVWIQSLTFRDGGDQVVTPVQVGGFDGLKATQNYLNIADSEYPAWADDPILDILVLVYGDSGILNADGFPRNYVFLTGSLPELGFVSGGEIPLEARNFQWNWVLFRIENGIRGSDGQSLIGTIAADAAGDITAGGVNGGTIRFESVPGLTVRAVAFGPEGSFGEPEAINIFNPAEECPAVPDTNYVWVDINAGTNSHLQVLNDGDQLTEIDNNVGLPGDQRTAVRPVGSFLNTGITDQYLGQPCNEPESVKICVEYFDDPAKAGVRFGPEAYATDAQTGVGFAPDSQYATLDGSGMWVRRSWNVGGVGLRGVNTGDLTGTVRLFFDAPVHISRIDIALIRRGEHPLAGQDPLANCYRDPSVCAGIYGNYAEMNLAAGIFDGISPGTSGGDQEMLEEEAGPPGDRRLAVRPAFDDGNPGFNHQFLNFAITDDILGPTSQPNAHLAIAVTYYDDPNLLGATLRPEVYQSEQADGTSTLRFPPAEIAAVVQGSGQWVDAYWELPDVKFIGVNQAPQAAARFALSGKIPVTRVRYAVIRSCGPDAGFNALAHAKPQLTVDQPASGFVRLAWPAGQPWSVQWTDSLTEGTWETLPDFPDLVDFRNVLEIPLPAPSASWFRLSK